jgi:gamma-glutamyl hercynylcysteine S-oxide synthase
MATQATALERHHQLLRRLAEARVETDDLFEIVRPEALYDRPIAARHRIVFYIGHLEAFDHNLLAPDLGLEALQPHFDRLFAFGIDPVGGGLPTDKPSDWPALKEVRRYRDRVRERLDGRIAEPAAVSDGHRAQLLQVAIEHRLMHAETLAYMFHKLPLDRKITPTQPREPERSAVARRMIEIPAGTATLGSGRSGNQSETFGWDNEFEAQRVEVPGFAIDAHNVTNGQFLKFVEAGGYSEKSLWSEEAWDWIESHGIQHPQFWVQRAGSWFFRTLFDERPLPLDWPVYVSHAEASAYVRWAGKALPTEAQFHRAAYGTPEGGERAYPWGNEPPDQRRGNFNFHRWHPEAVGSHPVGRSAFGVEDLVGNGWEWTTSVFGPFPGFEPFPFYPGYSANFFDGKHYVLKGASARTAGCLLRRSFRNWFQPHYPFVYATFRCVTK